MAISRNTKTGGGTSVNTGSVWNADDVNVDMDTMFNKLNTGLLNADIAAGAGIVYSKLSLANSIVTGDIVDGTIVNADLNAAAAVALTKLDDISGTAADAATATDPGVSNSESLATTGAGELERLRYAVERQALGPDAGRFDASAILETCYWGDLPVRNLQRIPGINGVVTSGLPAGWTNVNTATLAQQAADAADGLAGKGRAIQITAAGSANEGMSYTLSGLKESTRYFVGALMKATAADTAKLTVTGADAASSFRDLTTTTTSTTWTWITGVVQTDATPTNLVVSVLAAADTDIVWVADVVWGECSAVPQAHSPRVAVIEQRVSSTAGTAIDGATTDAGLDTNYQFIDNGTTDLDLTVYVPGDGYYIEVTGDFQLEETTANSGVIAPVRVRIYQSVNGAALASVRERYTVGEHDGTDNVQHTFTGSMTWVVKSPNPGQSYRYGLAANISAGSSTITPQLGSRGSSALTVRVMAYGG